MIQKEIYCLTPALKFQRTRKALINLTITA